MMMKFEQLPKNKQEGEEERMDPEKVLQYMVKLGNDIAEEARQAEAMLEEAKDRGIDVDISKGIKKFEPTEEVEVQLINIRSALARLKSEMSAQGVKMTVEDLRNRLDKMQ